MPCRACTAIGLPCTQNREQKRRGPPNRHAEAAREAQRRRLDTPATDAPVYQSPASHSLPSPARSTHSAAVVQQQQQLPPINLTFYADAEAIAPFDVVLALVDDFFTYIHPLTPFPHEPTFRAQLLAREDRTNREFLALLAAMIGALVASFPRAAREHLKQNSQAQSQSSSARRFPRATAMVSFCKVVAHDARHSVWRDGRVEPCDIDDQSITAAATSYFLGLAAGYTLDFGGCRRYFNEALSIIRELGYFRPRSGGKLDGQVAKVPPRRSVLEEQMGRRIFWVMFLGGRSLTQLSGSHHDIVVLPETDQEAYPDLPALVDDEFILADHLGAQPTGVTPLTAGFNWAIAMYRTMDPLVKIGISGGMTTRSWEEQRELLMDALTAAKHAVDGIPESLRVPLSSDANLEQRPPSGRGTEMMPTPPVAAFADQAPDARYYPPAHQTPTQANDLRQLFATDPVFKRATQLQIQKANIYTSQMATRSYYVENYFSLREAQPSKVASAEKADAFLAAEHHDGNESGSGHRRGRTRGEEIHMAMTVERELIVTDLLAVLAALQQRSLEPNGAALINKIRQVASTLLTKGAVSAAAERNLSGFVELLMRLEHTGAGGAHSRQGSGLDGVAVGAAGEVDGTGAGLETGSSGEEEEELRAWADWRDHQRRFVEKGGYLGAGMRMTRVDSGGGGDAGSTA
jgi:hypothetical protein